MTIREAATVALLRDRCAQLEVLLLRRHSAHVFAANAYVFPGGAVDRADGDAGLAARVAGGLEYAEACLGDTGAPTAYWTAAIRECFEEAGMLIACEAGHVEADRHRRLRDALNNGDMPWAAVIDALDLTFHLERLVYFSHWTTPAGAPKRYSTRFFAAHAPVGQQALCDGSETIQAWWARPADALAACERGEIHLMTPTRATLRRLAGYADASAALDGLAERITVQA
ncbi:NUDIX hydrolase [Salinisphaera sp. T31B1]|uniref:NUDIX hydrolase n=1 Tax=Salinisphaera sp. T31B1 TaxID=727963 RepID=UPI00333ED9FA